MKKTYWGMIITAVLYCPLSYGLEGSDTKSLCCDYPGEIQALFDALNLNYPGLEDVKTAVEKNDLFTSCNALVSYYRTAGTCPWLRKAPVNQGTGKDTDAENILKDTFTFQSVTGTQPRRSDGGLDWLNLGPRNDPEWAYFLNRHHIFISLLDAYQTTGNPDYSAHFDILVRDWVIANPCPEDSEWTVNWRVLEAGLRMADSWPEVFYGFLQADEFTPAGIILMLSSIHGHADYLRKYHWKQHNHAAMELYGLARAALCWPEFRESENWQSYASSEMIKEIEFEVYPDGVQNELTSHYHGVALNNFEKFANLFDRNGKPVSSSFKQKLEDMYSYMAYSIRPDGHGLLNNDSNLDFNRPLIEKTSQKYNRPDWLYIVSNGSEGTKPEGLPSAIYPWAGHLIMRNSWNDDAHWAFFDFGPWGWSHQHDDRLHISATAYGRDILVDSGRLWYKPDIWRSWIISSHAHNVILLDDMGQKKDDLLSAEPFRYNYASLSKFDFAVGTFDKGFESDRFSEEEGKAQIGKPKQENGLAVQPVTTKHSRAVLYLRGKFWVVVDHIASDKPHEAKALWHFHPDCTVAVEGNTVVSTDDGKGNIRIHPVGDINWNIDLIRGKETPDIQGWYSVRYNEKTPNTVAMYKGSIDSVSTFAWILLPDKGKVPMPDVSILPAPEGSVRFMVSVDGGKPVEVAVRMSGNKPVIVSGELFLDGACAALLPGEKPLVALGRIRDKQWKVVARQLFEDAVIR